MMGKNEVSMKDYYESKIASRDQDNDTLKKQLKEKDTDLRSVVDKYHHLEKRMR